MDQYLKAAVKLHGYLVAHHWTGQALVGPDPGLRLNYRIGRFVKGYLDRVRWRDDVYFLQAQGYWILDNWGLFESTHDEKARQIAIRCSDHVLGQQRPDGAWDYPLPQWKGRFATVEGIWAALGLLETYRHTTAARFLSGAVRWHAFMTERIGYQKVADGLAINYFANYTEHAVPNNSTDVLRFLAEIAQVSRDTTYLQPCTGIIAFLRRAQRGTGEFPYIFKKDGHAKGRPHFQCYQYNAFQCLGLIRYYEITGDGTVLPIITRLLAFLRGGLAEDGHAHYMCGNRHRTVTYHTAVLGAAFARAAQSGLDGYLGVAQLAFSYVMGLQEPDGRLLHSQRDYRMLSDRRSYPRYLAMILSHFLAQSVSIQSLSNREPSRLCAS